MKRLSFWRERALVAILMLSAVPEGARAAQPTHDPKQWFCEGLAKGAKHAEVTVDWYVQADGTVVGRSASWTPPSLVVTAPAELRVAMFDLSILYYDPTKDGFGPSGSILVDLEGSRRIDGSTVTFELDDQRRWTVALKVFPPVASHEDDPDRLFLTGDLADPDLLAAVETGGGGLATFSDKTGRTLGQIRYDLGAHAERDRLYRMAWADAERAAQHPKRCQETVEDPRFEPPSIPIP